MTNGELDALEWLRARGGYALASMLDERSTRGVFGDTEPGMAMFRKLAKRGLVTITDEDLIDEAQPELGEWSSTVELTDAGRSALTTEKHDDR